MEVVPEARVDAMPPSVASAPRIDEKCDAARIDLLVQLLARHTRFHGGIQIFRAHPKNRVHPRQVQRNPAEKGVNLALDGAPGPKRNDGDAVARADLEDLAHLSGGLRETNDVRQTRRMPRLTVAMLLPYRLPGGDSSPEKCR